jgi:hypothetical protein
VKRFRKGLPIQAYLRKDRRTAPARAGYRAGRAAVRYQDGPRNGAADRGYFITQSADDPCVYTTFERFADRVAMDKHNASEAVARFVRDVGSHFDGDIVIHVGEEIAFK